MRKKGLVFAEFPSPYRVKVMEELAKEYNLTVFFNSENEERNPNYVIKNSTINYYLLDNNNGKKEFIKCCKKLNYFDFVLNYNIGIFNGVRIMWACIVNNVPCFVNSDGQFINNKNILKSLIKKFLISRAALCFGSGESSKRYFLTYGAKEENIRCHHFTSLEDEDILKGILSEDEKINLKKQMNLINKKIVLTVGRFIPSKGFDVLLEAWKHVKRDYQLLIIGGGSLEQSYMDYINENKLENIKIIDYKPKKDLFNYYKASDLFVLPTRWDVWGLVINEAMACGLPIVTTNMCIAGLELIENGVNGYIIPVDDQEALANKINMILQNGELAKAMSINNVNKIQGYTMANMGKKNIKDINDYFLINKG